MRGGTDSTVVTGGGHDGGLEHRVCMYVCVHVRAVHDLMWCTHAHAPSCVCAL